MDALNRTLLCLVLGFMELAAAIKTTVGKDAVLPCKVEKQGDLRVLQWSKEGLGQDYVFYFRDNKPLESFQNPSFKGRVKLQDAKMTDGDMSIVLSNTTLSDAGKYSCKVVMETETIKTISLEVNEKKEEEVNDLGLKVGLPIGLLGLLAAVVGGFFWYRQGKNTDTL
ncbi:CD276 antigen homolog isoform X2 [Cyprinodon tularosa]|uniref:CD276 antigen homolog isoform X2 n=1 Tax=Cyprinodon tularosa TaxID=77115 RepID=UPI0018E1EBAA|nr:CD276 antigen homolog isoform X2 [Cyprinodon tularosa]